MTVGELVEVLQRLPQDHEIALLTANGIARPPVAVKVKRSAGWEDNGIGARAGLQNPARAFLLRPEREIV